MSYAVKFKVGFALLASLSVASCGDNAPADETAARLSDAASGSIRHFTFDEASNFFRVRSLSLTDEQELSIKMYECGTYFQPSTNIKDCETGNDKIEYLVSMSVLDLNRLRVLEPSTNPPPSDLHDIYSQETLYGGANFRQTYGYAVKILCEPNQRCLRYPNMTVEKTGTQEYILPCPDEKICAQVVDDLKLLAQQLADGEVSEDPALDASLNPGGGVSQGGWASGPPKPQSGGPGSDDLVGIWELEADGLSGWVTQFRNDGTYRFTDGQSVLTGRYKAQNGRFTNTSDISADLNDEGTYRLIDDRTLILTGKQGTSRWIRRQY